MGGVEWRGVQRGVNVEEGMKLRREPLMWLQQEGKRWMKVQKVLVKVLKRVARKVSEKSTCQVGGGSTRGALVPKKNIDSPPSCLDLISLLAD